MQQFEHINVSTVNEAVSALKKYKGRAKVIAGGTDLLGCLRDGVWPEFPEAIINLKLIPNLSYIVEDNEGLKIGSMTTLTEIADSDLIKEKYPSLAEAARRTASPLIRNIGTLGGNLCQENRCWYYRYPKQLGGRIDCIRKGGEKCLAVQGDNRYHSIFGAVKKCIAVNPSDTAPALVSLSSHVRTSKRLLDINNFFTATNGMKSTVLEDDEIVLEIVIPRPQPGTSMAFRKIALRKTIDFAIVNCAVCLTEKDGVITSARICLNGVYNNPYRAKGAEEALIGKSLDENLVSASADIAVSNAKPFPMNRYKVQIAKALVKDTLMDCA